MMQRCCPLNMLKTITYNHCVTVIKPVTCRTEPTSLRSQNMKRDTYSFQNKLFIVTVIHEKTDLPACVTVNGIHLK